MPNRRAIRQTITVSCIFPTLLALLGFSRNLNIGNEAPDFALKGTNSQEISLTSLRGKTVIVVFWRPEQERSIQALAALQSIYIQFKEQDVEVLALSTDKEGPELITRVRQSKQLTFPMLYDSEEKAYGDYGVIVTPSTFIISKAGKLSYYYPGYRDDLSRQVSGRLQVLLGKKTLEELQAELQPPRRPEPSQAEKKAARYLKAGNRLLEKGMFPSAMRQYQKAVQEKPDLFQAHLHLGHIHLNQKNIQEADAEFKRAIELKPRSAEAHAGLGDVFFLQGHHEKALEMLQIALKFNPKLARAHYRLGRVYEEQKQIEDALKEYRTALRLLLKIEE